MFFFFFFLCSHFTLTFIGLSPTNSWLPRVRVDSIGGLFWLVSQRTKPSVISFQITSLIIKFKLGNCKKNLSLIWFSIIWKQTKQNQYNCEFGRKTLLTPSHMIIVTMMTMYSNNIVNESTGPNDASRWMSYHFPVIVMICGPLFGKNTII